MSTFYPENDYRNYLQHYGVKGMRWRNRRHYFTGKSDPADRLRTNSGHDPFENWNRRDEGENISFKPRGGRAHTAHVSDSIARNTREGAKIHRGNTAAEEARRRAEHEAGRREKAKEELQRQMDDRRANQRARAREEMIERNSYKTEYSGVQPSGGRSKENVSRRRRRRNLGKI